MAQAQIREPNGPGLTVEVANFQISGNAVEIWTTDGKSYLTAMDNVLIISDIREGSAPAPTKATDLGVFGVDKTAIAEDIVKLVSGIKWDFVEKDGKIDSTATIVNTTGHDISGVTIQIKLADNDGVPLENQTVYLTDWKKGETQTLSFQTTKPFSTYAWWVENFLL